MVRVRLVLLRRAESSLDATSSQAASNWGNARTPGDPNNLPLAVPNFDVVTESIWRPPICGDYLVGWSHDSMFYNGQQGRPYSISFNNTDVNGERILQ